MKDHRTPATPPRQKNDHPERPIRPASGHPGRDRAEHPRT